VTRTGSEINGDASNMFRKANIIKQLLPALVVNIMIVHLWDVVFPWAKALG
jgi:hypothetical protein